MQQRPAVVTQRLAVEWTLLLVAGWHSLRVNEGAQPPVLLVGVLAADHLLAVLVVAGGTAPTEDVLERAVVAFHHNYSLAFRSPQGGKSQITVKRPGVAAEVLLELVCLGALDHNNHSYFAD